MTDDADATARFYGTAAGGVAARLLGERLTLLWPDLAGMSVLGIGYAVPYLPAWRERAARCVALTPAQAGVAHWPAGGPSLSCTAEDDALPFPDLCFDRILLVHGLEAAENARRQLRETWRVLKDDGRLIIVATNRRGMWAHSEHTPFGHGQPYSFGQLNRLLAASMYRAERRDTALYVPPTNWRPLLKSAALVDRTGRRYVSGLAGVTITEAVKDVYAAMPVDAGAVRRVVLSVAEAA